MNYSLRNATHPTLRPMLLILLAALVIRFLYFFEFRETPYYDNLVVDAKGYDLNAWEIAQGNWMGGQEIFFQDPLYTYILASIYSVAGHTPTAIYLVQVIIGSITSLLVFLLAYRVFSHSHHRTTIATLSGFLSALSTPLLFFDFLLLKTTLTVFLTVAHLLALVTLADTISKQATSLKKALWICLIAGLLLGLNLLNRGNYILLTPLFGLWMTWVIWQNTKSPRITLFLLMIYSLGVFLILTPVTARNYYVGGEWVLVTSQGGINLYVGNNSGADGTLARPAGIRTNPLTERYDYLALAEQETGRTFTWGELNNYYRDKAIDWVTHYPGDAARLFLRKWGLWLAAYEIPDNYSFSFIKKYYSTTLKFPLASAYGFAVLGWSGLIIALFRIKDRSSLLTLRHAKTLLLAAFVLVYSLSITLFYVKSRLRLPIYPELMIFAAATLMWGLIQWRQTSLNMRLGIFAIVVFTGALVWRPQIQTGWPGLEKNDEGTQFFNLGVIQLHNGATEHALNYFDIAADHLSGNPTIFDALANAYNEMGYPEKTQTLYRKKTQDHPYYLNGWYNMAMYSLSHNQLMDAEQSLLSFINNAKGHEFTLPPSSPHPLLLLGDIYVATNRQEEAQRMYRNYLTEVEWDYILANPGYIQAIETLINSQNSSDSDFGNTALLEALNHAESDKSQLNKLYNKSPLSREAGKYSQGD